MCESIRFDEVSPGEVFEGRKTGNKLVKSDDGVTAYVISLGAKNGKADLGKRVELNGSTLVLVGHVDGE